jgi:glutaredoxin
MKDYINIYSLNGCGYSRRSEVALINNNIEHKVIKVEWDNMSKYKKQNKMNTFPQIFYVDKKEKKHKIGGSDDLNKILAFNEIIKKDYKNMEKLLDNNDINLKRKILLKILFLINKK